MLFVIGLPKHCEICIVLRQRPRVLAAEQDGVNGLISLCTTQTKNHDSLWFPN